MTLKDFFDIIKKSSLAAILISFGVGVLLSIGNPIGPFLFAFGLLCVCGYQHCIANIIVLGVAGTFSHTILLCIVGNLIGSIIINILGEEKCF